MTEMMHTFFHALVVCTLLMLGILLIVDGISESPHNPE